MTTISHVSERKLETREEWLATRERLLAREKGHTRLGDAIARLRRLDHAPKGRDEGEDRQLRILRHDKYERE